MDPEKLRAVPRPHCGASRYAPGLPMADRKALARQIAKRKPPRLVREKPARMKRPKPEGEGPWRGDDLLEYEAALRFIFWNDPKGIDL